MTTAKLDTYEVPTNRELMNPTLDALFELGGSATNGEITTQVIKDLGLSSEIVEAPHITRSNTNAHMTELEYRLAWSRTYLKMYGAIENSTRGVWSLTAKGRNVGQVDPQEVTTFVRQLQGKRESVKNSEVSFEATSIDDAESEELEDEETEWREHLLKTLLEMTSDAFERLCQLLLRESGFIEVEVTGRPSDGGIDGRGIIRLGGLIGFAVLFQCKRYSSNVGVGVVRDFRGAMQGRADKGLIITTSNFTQEAQIEATRDGAPPIDLINGELLLDKLKELGLGVSTSTRTVEVVEVNDGWFNTI